MRFRIMKWKLSEVNEIIFGKNSETNLIQVQLNELKLFPSIPISKMGEEQWKDPLLTLLYELVQRNSKQNCLKFIKFDQSLFIRCYFNLIDFSLIEGVLHCQAILHGRGGSAISSTTLFPEQDSEIYS